MTGLRAIYRTFSPVTVLPMIMRWISDLPSKNVKLVDAPAVSAGRCRAIDGMSAPAQSWFRRPVSVLRNA
jgi:hypothetical protein